MDRVRSVAIFALLAGLPAFHTDLGAAQHEAHGAGAHPRWSKRFVAPPNNFATSGMLPPTTGRFWAA